MFINFFQKSNQCLVFVLFPNITQGHIWCLFDDIKMSALHHENLITLLELHFQSNSNENLYYYQMHTILAPFYDFQFCLFLLVLYDGICLHDSWFFKSMYQ